MIALTGASGYLGRALLAALRQEGADVVSVGRTAPSEPVGHRELDLSANAGFRVALDGVRSVIHAAGLAHNLGSAEAYEQVNVRATMALADAAIAAGARRFIFVSSLNVVPANADDPRCRAASLPRPDTAYAHSKWRAEQTLEALFAHSSTELVIVRPALIYDLDLTANLATLHRLARRLPFALPAVGARSMIDREDLVRLLCHLALTQDALMQAVPPLVATDGECYSAKRIGRALGAKASLSLPISVWKLLSRVWDLRTHGTAGATWQSLAQDHWCGHGRWTPKLLSALAAGRMDGDGVHDQYWQPRYTLETRLSTVGARTERML